MKILARTYITSILQPCACNRNDQFQLLIKILKSHRHNEHQVSLSQQNRTTRFANGTSPWNTTTHSQTKLLSNHEYVHKRRRERCESIKILQGSFLQARHQRGRPFRYAFEISFQGQETTNRNGVFGRKGSDILSINMGECTSNSDVTVLRFHVPKHDLIVALSFLTSCLSANCHPHPTLWQWNDT